MVEELKPYQLVQTYSEARHSRFNSWVFSLLAAGSAIAGVGAFISELPNEFRYPLSLGFWTGSLVLVNRSATASRQANLYARRVTALETASEDSYVYNLMRSVQPSLPPIELQATLETSFYNWANAVDEGVGFIIAGNSGAGKSCVATWLAGLLTQEKPHQCLVLDPHWNDIWKQQGLAAMGHITQIEATIKALLKELDDRCDRKGQGLPLGEPLLIIADEIGACLERFKDAKWIQSALKRLGSEGRKFDMTLIAINQSQNVDDLGISGSLRNNYVLILLGAAARKYSQQMGKDYNEKLKGVAYPCLVSGAAEDSLAVHPTHGEYQIFRKKGNAPQNLIPIRQLPLTFLDDAGMELPGSDRPAIAPGATAPTLEQFSQEFAAPTPRELLEQSFNLPTANEHESIADSAPKQPDIDWDDIPDHLHDLIKYSLKYGWVTARKVKQNVRLYSSSSTEEIRSFFLAAMNAGVGMVRGEGDRLQYAAILGETRE